MLLLTHNKSYTYVVPIHRDCAYLIHSHHHNYTDVKLIIIINDSENTHTHNEYLTQWTYFVLT